MFLILQEFLQDVKMLPKIEHPIFTTTLPISKITIEYRPLLVKEEKLLLLAKEANDLDYIVNTLKQVIKNTVQSPIDIDSLSIIDLQWIFIQLRIQSVGKIIKCTVTDPIDKKDYDIEVDLSELYVKFNNYKNVIKLSNTLGMKMKLPGLNDVRDVSLYSSDFTSLTFNLLLSCVESVFDDESEFTNFTKEELTEFIDSLNSEQIQRVVEFFDNLPKLTLKYSYTTADGNKKEWEVDKFRDFFI